MNANDRQVGGDHYKQFEIDPWDAIAIFCPKSLTGVEIYLWGCAFKYLVRLGSKNSPLEDIEKAEHYLQKLRETLEKKLANRVTTVEDRIGHHEVTINSHEKIKFEEMVGGNFTRTKKTPTNAKPSSGLYTHGLQTVRWSTTHSTTEPRLNSPDVRELRSPRNPDQTKRVSDWTAGPIFARSVGRG